MSFVRKLGRASARVLAGLVLFGTVIAQAQPYKGSWEPYSKTATSVTGSVAIETQQITFTGGKKPMVLNTKLVDTRAGRWLFAVTGSPTGAMPLANGNSLCAPGQLPTYITVTMNDKLLMIAVTAQARQPSLSWTGDMPPGDCGAYHYSLQTEGTRR